MSWCTQNVSSAANSLRHVDACCGLFCRASRAHLLISAKQDHILAMVRAKLEAWEPGGFREERAHLDEGMLV